MWLHGHGARGPEFDPQSPHDGRTDSFQVSSDLHRSAVKKVKEKEVTHGQE